MSAISTRPCSACTRTNRLLFSRVDDPTDAHQNMCRECVLNAYPADCTVVCMDKSRWPEGHIWKDAVA